MRSMLCAVFIVAVLLAVSVRGQEYENSGENNFENNEEDSNDDEDNNDQGSGSSWITKLINIVKKFVRDVMSLFQEFKAVFEEKTRGVVIWTEELWVGMKKDMNDWIDEYDYATDEEKDEMRKYLDKLEMPKESDEDEY